MIENNNNNKLIIIEGPCWSCKHKMKICYIDADQSTIYPENFIQEDIDLATGNGVKLAKCNSKTAGYAYLGNICPNCGKLCGNYYINIDYIFEAFANKEYPYVVLNAIGKYDFIEE